MYLVPGIAIPSEFESQYYPGVHEPLYIHDIIITQDLQDILDRYHENIKIDINSLDLESNRQDFNLASFRDDIDKAYSLEVNNNYEHDNL